MNCDKPHSESAGCCCRLKKAKRVGPPVVDWRDEYLMLARDLNNKHAVHMEGVVRAYEDKVKEMQEELADLYADAMELAPNDMILQFAYAQALFANERYTEAAQNIRTALEKVSPAARTIAFIPFPIFAKIF